MADCHWSTRPGSNAGSNRPCPSDLRLRRLVTALNVRAGHEACAGTLCQSLPSSPRDAPCAITSTPVSLAATYALGRR